VTKATKIWDSPQERAYTEGWRACMETGNTVGRRLYENQHEQRGYDEATRLLRFRKMVEYYQRKEGQR
jgi:hypothetical protein